MLVCVVYVALVKVLSSLQNNSGHSPSSRHCHVMKFASGM